MSNAESILCGTPVIAFNNGGISEVVTNHFDGVLIETCTAAQLKEEIRMLWNSDERLNALKENCSKCTYASVDQYAGSIMQYYV